MRRTEDITEGRITHREYDRIESTIVDLYEKLCIDHIPVDPFSIASKLGYKVKKYSDLPRHYKAYLIELGLDGLSCYDPATKSYIICYDDSHSQTRIRFTMMHEIGHIVLGHKQESKLANKIADFFAGYFLAPSPLISLYECKNSKEVADQFDISQDCADICFRRFQNWKEVTKSLKQYELKLLDLFS